MKINHVILTSNDDPNYHQFWNPISKTYSEKFGIKCTLIWLGVKEDIERLKLSDEFGNIIIQYPHPKHHIGWQTAWAIFYFMSKFPEDVFLTMGIDQVPLSDKLLRISESVDDDCYLMLVDDAYTPSHWSTGGTSPTSYHIVKGSVANEVYNFEETFHAEIDKIDQAGIVPYYGGQTKWGLDESYASHKLRQYRDDGGKVIGKSIFKEICDTRIECCRVNETPYDAQRLKDGGYGDAHFCRPFNDHRVYIETILNLIPQC